MAYKNAAIETGMEGSPSFEGLALSAQPAGKRPNYDLAIQGADIPSYKNNELFGAQGYSESFAQTYTVMEKAMQVVQERQNAQDAKQVADQLQQHLATLPDVDKLKQQGALFKQMQEEMIVRPDPTLEGKANLLQKDMLRTRSDLANAQGSALMSVAPYAASNPAFNQAYGDIWKGTAASIARLGQDVENETSMETAQLERKRQRENDTYIGMTRLAGTLRLNADGSGLDEESQARTDAYMEAHPGADPSVIHGLVINGHQGDAFRSKMAQDTTDTREDKRWDEQRAERRDDKDRAEYNKYADGTTDKKTLTAAKLFAEDLIKQQFGWSPTQITQIIADTSDDPKAKEKRDKVIDIQKAAATRYGIPSAESVLDPRYTPPPRLGFDDWKQHRDKGIALDQPLDSTTPQGAAPGGEQVPTTTGGVPANSIPEPTPDDVAAVVKVLTKDGKPPSRAEAERYWRDKHAPKDEGQLRPQTSASDKYSDTIASAAQTHGVPESILHGVLQTESAFSPEVVSGERRGSSGEIGVAQFMPATAKERWVDPKNPESSIYGSASYLSDLYKMFGSWDKAIAAYNTGPGTVQKKGITPAGRKYVRSVRSNTSERPTPAI